MLRPFDQVTTKTSDSAVKTLSIANVDGPMGVHPFDLGGANGGLPTALALPPIQGDPVRFGEEAFGPGADLALMTNWKLLLGKTDIEVMTERKNSDPLNRALERATLEEISRLERTAALGISRMNRTVMKHVNVYQEAWSRIKEITHDGATMGLSTSGSDDGLRYFTADSSDFSDWFAVLMEDATETLGGFQLEGSSFGER